MWRAVNYKDEALYKINIIIIIIKDFNPCHIQFL